MTDTLVAALTGVAIVAMLCFTALRAWRGWLDLRRLHVDRQPAVADEEDNVGVRIELAAVRERLKKLEAIASGVEL